MPFANERHTMQRTLLKSVDISLRSPDSGEFCNANAPLGVSLFPEGCNRTVQCLDLDEQVLQIPNQ